MNNVIFIDFAEKRKASEASYGELTIRELDAFEMVRDILNFFEVPEDRKVMLKTFLDFYRPHYEYISRRCGHGDDFENDDE